MRILQISPQVPYPPTDGGRLSIYGLMKYLALRNHNIDFVCYRKHLELDLSLSFMNKYTNPYILDVQTDNNALKAFVNLFSATPYNISKYRNKKLREFLQQYFKDNSPNAVVINNLHMGWIIDYIKSVSKAPVILRQENYESMIMKRYYENESNIIYKSYAWMQYIKLLKYEPALCEKFDKVVMITKNDEERLLKLNSKIKTAVAPVGVEKKLLDFEIAPKEPYTMAHIGQLDWLPNLDSLNWFLNYILPKIVHDIPDAKLYIIGKGNAGKIKIPTSVKKNVIYLGYVEDIWTALKNVSLIVVPLRIGSGIRVKILEMMAAGHNVITTSIGKEGIEAYDNDHLMIADLQDEFADKIISFFKNMYDIPSMINNSRNLIREKYTWEVISEKFENEIKNIKTN